MGLCKRIQILLLLITSQGNCGTVEEWKYLEILLRKFEQRISFSRDPQSGIYIYWDIIAEVGLGISLAPVSYYGFRRKFTSFPPVSYTVRKEERIIVDVGKSLVSHVQPLELFYVPLHISHSNLRFVFLLTLSSFSFREPFHDLKISLRNLFLFHWNVSFSSLSRI